ncbi:branched-chain-amino-acid transaminase [Candidatus Poribacteria bacterium]|jgi:branched-chain amino acid aminotransferase|nr:branched-chain-amino-acid transaminase [Candidatus Poribacteria bacterium]MBT5536165.1 branched-chain-amino-acid transaminase [Candidatus Poribacteria bacterium]MBT5713163.1 branched-chain-amino-acid transaminase [Candidatus Poribacteria bacterium]MBT7809062.1 branched-chain-amino-acid transaminase [Candidatus Poribacteria bacterium]
MQIYLNGEFVPKERASVSVFDHGLLYGDGVFEGIRAYNGRVFRLAEHVRRLYDSAHAIRLTIPMSMDEMEEVVRASFRKNDIRDGYARLVVTRGVGDLGLNPDKCPVPTTFCIADTIALYPARYYEEGLAVVTAATRRNTPEALNPRIKSLNYLNNILAIIEGQIAGAQEVIMLNQEGYVVECSGDNIFLARGDALITPPTHVGALAGITRDAVIELADEIGVPTEERIFTRYDVYTADECFLTGTAAEVVPVVSADSRPIGDGKPGSMTGKLIEAFRELTRTSGSPVYPDVLDA